MRRTIVAAAVVGAALAVAGIPGAALAGGGCHGGMTEADATGQDEATVHMVDACFDPSVLRVDPGASVTFVSGDAGMTHNVGGTEWGFYGEMREGDTFTATFDDAGVYPFACSYHPGMTGAIVVGDGKGAGAGWTVTNEGPFEAAPKEAPAPTPAATSSSAPWIAAAAIAGLAVGAVAAGAVIGGRRRRAAPAA
jgi:plastocyanin